MIVFFQVDTKYRKFLSSEARECDEDEKSGRVLCRSCGLIITNKRYSIQKNGSHIHSFVNPHGYVFEIALFSEASGCATYGTPTYLHTWFEGYSWNYAVCSACKSHLGWKYHGQLDSFFGLITDRILQEDDDR